MIGLLMLGMSAGSNGSLVITPRMAEFDLAEVKVKEPTCIDRGQTDDIIVCGPKGMDIWIGNAGDFAGKPFRPELAGPFNSRATVHVIQQDSLMGRSPAAAVTLKWKF